MGPSNIISARGERQGPGASFTYAGPEDDGTRVIPYNLIMSLYSTSDKLSIAISHIEIDLELH